MIKRKKFFSSILASTVFATTMFTFPVVKAATSPYVVNVGSGGYMLIPNGTQDYDGTVKQRSAELQWMPTGSNVYKTANVKGPVPTTDWATSVIWGNQWFSQDSGAFSNALYAHPAAFKATAEGLEMNNPPKQVVPVNGDRADIRRPIQPGFVDLLINGVSFKPASAKADKITDWQYDILMEDTTDKTKTTTATIAHGSPYVFLKYNNVKPKIDMKRGTLTQVVSGTLSSQALLVKIEDNFEGDWNYYGIYAPSGTTWTIPEGLSSERITSITANLPVGKNYISIAMLPDGNLATFDYFKKYAYNFLTDTKVAWSYNETNKIVTTNFTATTENKVESAATGTLMALYPHQWRNNSSLSLTQYTYPSVSGTMKVMAGTTFKVDNQFTGILPWMPSLSSTENSKLQGYLNSFYSAFSTNGQFMPGGLSAIKNDTYWTGKLLNKMYNVLPVAEQIGDTTKANNIYDKLKKELEDWFTPTNADGSLNTDRFFYYNQDVGTIIGYPSSFGTDTQLNDHHFHYGYWIHAAAQIATRDPQWAAQYGGMVEELIRDIANWERHTDSNPQRYPFLRHMDPYAGHSWASGHQLFDDGNNHESSSEAMNAWTGIILWGEATGNKQIRDLGIYLYTTEMQAINNYWYDMYNDVFDAEYKAYNNEVASMIWGGKYVFATWWTADPLQTYAINLLPLNAGSLYLGQFPQKVQKVYDRAYQHAATYSGPDKNLDRWQDVFNKYLALANPSRALLNWKDTFAENGSDGKEGVEFAETKANTYHYIKSLDQYGTPDFSVYAVGDGSTLSSVFSKNGVRTYVVYNPTSTQKVVNFSNNISITVGARSMYVGQGQQMTDAQAVDADKTALYVGYASGDSAASVKSNVTLPTSGANGTTITWASSNTAVISTTGVVTRQTANTAVTLTATIRKGTASTTKTFTLTVIAKDAAMTDAQAVTADSNALAVGYTTGDGATSVKGNVTLSAAGANGSTITWASSNTAVISNAGVVTRPAANTNVTLTATIRKGTASATKTFTLTVIAKETSSDIIDTAHFTVTLQKLSDTSAKLVLAPKVTIDWVDIHYMINSGSQQNVRMLKVGSNWEQTITNLINGDTIKYNFTYFTTYGQDSAWFTSVFNTGGTNPLDPNVTAVEADKAALAIGYVTGDSATSVKSNVTLPTTGANGSTITWASNTTSVVSNTGVVTRPSYTSGNKTVTLTATLTKGTATTTKSFTVTVIALTMTDTDAVNADKNALAIGYASGDSATSVKSKLTLPTTGANGTTITWASSNTAVVSTTGVVTRPSANTNVTLTATIKKGTVSSTKSFTVTVIAAETGFVTNDFNVSFTKTSTTSAKIVVTPKVTINWVDIHYIVNTGGQLNVQMTKVNNNFEITINNLKAGDTVKYNFTYFTTAGYDSIWFTSGF
jgi:endoglucanase Acf2